MIILLTKKQNLHKVNPDMAVVTGITGLLRDSQLSSVTRNSGREPGVRRARARPVVVLMRNEVLCKSFVEFCGKNFCIESALFLQEVIDLRKETEQEKLLDKFREICGRFIDDNSDLTINISHKVKSALNGICT